MLATFCDNPKHKTEAPSSPASHTGSVSVSVSASLFFLSVSPFVLHTW